MADTLVGFPGADVEAISISFPAPMSCQDSERGVMAAKKANLFCFAIPNKMTAGSNFSQADIIVDSLYDILNHLNVI